MAVRYGESAYIYGLHDRGGEALMLQSGKGKGWVLVTEEIRANPADTGGQDYKALADQGFGVIVRLNHAYGPEGTIPPSARYDDFAKRVANFVRSSSGCHIWIIGNEMNLEREQPRGERITPRLYAECYRKCRSAIKSLAGHETDQVVVGAIGPWNAETPYEADPQGAYPANKIPGAPAGYPYNGYYGDFIRYFRDTLVAIGPENCDGLSLHAYSHGYDPALITNDDKMDAPFKNYHFNFRTYQDQLNAVPFAFRHLPVYLTEANGDANPDGSKWPDVNSGWIKNAYKEINAWNKAENQQIQCMILYRWSRADDWHIDGKLRVQQDFKEAVAKNYRWTAGVKPKKPAVTVQIQDISATLPVNATLPPYPTRSLNAIQRIVINHTATAATVTPLRIAQFQTTNQQRPRYGIAYHYCVAADGQIYQTQPLEVVSDHAGTFSADSVGVCLLGDFTEAPPPQAQLEATAALLAQLATQAGLWPGANTIVGYCDLAVTASPGKTWPTWKDSLIELTATLMTGGSPAPAQPGYLVRYVDHNTPAQMMANQTVTVDMTLQNAGTFAWVKGGANPFRLAFRWFDAQEQEFIFPPQLNLRTTLPADVPAGQVISLKAQLRAPSRAGTYRLQWDMVHEQVTWFGDQGDPGLVIEGLAVASATPDVSTGVGDVVITPVTGLIIQDISATLPVNAELAPYPTRALSDIRRFVINHTATAATVTPLRIAQFQTTNQKMPRPGIAYHYCVTAEGEVYQTQPLEVVSNHAGTASADSVGVCLIGDFTDVTPPPAQINAAAALMAQVGGQFGLAVGEQTIFGYSELTVTASPGKTWPAWKPQLIAQAQALAGGPVLPKPVTPTGKVIEHYLLFWRQSAGNWAEWDLISAIDYIGAFAPTVGFSIEQAKLARYVTIVGGAGGVPFSAEQTLKQAGCQVERLDGATEDETNRLLYERVVAGKPFRTFQ